MPNPWQKSTTEKPIMRWVPPGPQNKDRYHLIIGNLPFGGDWKDLKRWFDGELKRYASPGQEDRFKVDYTSTLSIGTGWVRVKGLDVFNAIKSISANCTYGDRNLFTFDKNETEWVTVLDTPAPSSSSSGQSSRGYSSRTRPRDSAKSQAPSSIIQPAWTWHYQSGPNETAVAEPPPGVYLPQGVDVYTVPGYETQMSIPSQYSPLSHTMPTSPSHYASPLPSSEEFEGYPSGFDNYGYASPISYPTISSHGEFHLPGEQPAHVLTEPRQVVIRDIPIKHKVFCNSPSHRRRDKLVSKNEVQEWIRQVVTSRGYHPTDIVKIHVPHKSSNPDMLAGHAVLHMSSADAAAYMVREMTGMQYSGRTLKVSLGKDETTISRNCGPASSSVGQRGSRNRERYGHKSGKKAEPPTSSVIQAIAGFSLGEDDEEYNEYAYECGPGDGSTRGVPLVVSGTNNNLVTPSPHPVIAVGSKAKKYEKKK